MFPSGHQDAELVEIPSISPRGSESLAYTVVPRTSARVRVCVVPCRSEFDQEECSTSLCASDFATLQRRGLLSPSWVATFRLPGCCFQEGMNGSSNRQHVWARGQGSDLKEASDFCQKLGRTQPPSSRNRGWVHTNSLKAKRLWGLGGDHALGTKTVLRPAHRGRTTGSNMLISTWLCGDALRQTWLRCSGRHSCLTRKGKRKVASQEGRNLPLASAFSQIVSCEEEPGSTSFVTYDLCVYCGLGAVDMKHSNASSSVAQPSLMQTSGS